MVCEQKTISKHSSFNCVLILNIELCHFAERPIIVSSMKSKIGDRLQRENFDFEENVDSNPEFFVKPSRQPKFDWSKDVIVMVPSKPEELSISEMIQIFEKLSLYKISDDTLVHEKFNTLIDSVRFHEKFLNLKQLVKIFKCICEAEVPMYDDLTEFIVKTLLLRMRFLTVDDIIDVDFTIRKFYAREFRLSKLLETLRQETRASFIDEANDELIEQQNSHRKSMRLLKYLSNNQTLMQNIDTTKLFKNLLSTNDDEFPKSDATYVIVSFSRFRSLNDSAKQLLTKAFGIWCNNAEDTDDIRAILKLLIAKKLNGINLLPFQNVAFIERCTKLTIEYGDIATALDVLDGFNKMVCINH